MPSNLVNFHYYAAQHMQETEVSDRELNNYTLLYIGKSPIKFYIAHALDISGQVTGLGAGPGD